MKISNRCQYALKAVFELASHNGDKPIKAQKIASAHNISGRFIEVILNDLKHGGFVESRRGNDGGYLLARNSKEITVGEVVEYIEGQISLGAESNENGDSMTPAWGQTAFQALWDEVNSNISQVLYSKTLADMVNFELAARDSAEINYCI